ncbi:MAG TPA: DUF4389 domain-containing protein [Gemmatimonadales bacterium]|nr:DUF4389 domain-containing protein [Gemmatimonadales bacterium]
MHEAPDEYPAWLEIDYPDRPLNRLTTFFRPITVIPIAILLGLLAGPVVHAGSEDYSFASGGVLFFPTALMLLFRRKYPAWWFNWNLELVRFSTRITAYLALLRDEYPSTDEEQAIRLDVPYPDALELNRWLPLVKWLLAIPHYIALAFLGIGATVCVIVAWFAILFTGRYPRTLFDFVVGVFRWWLRVAAYAFLLTTDRYPPFRLVEPTSRESGAYS